MIQARSAASKHPIVILLLSILLLFVCSQCKQPESSLSLEEFENPSTEYRPLALWTWMNGYVDTNQLVYEIKEMKAKGMRGALIWDIGSLADKEKMIPEGPAFLGPQSLDYISLALKTTAEEGLNLGMVASSSWNAGGEWIEPKDASKQLLQTSQLLSGPGTKTFSIIPPQKRNRPIEHYTLIASVALPYSGSSKSIDGFDQAIRLDNQTIDGTSIEWDVPEGEWEVFSFFSCNTMQPLVCPSPNSNGLIIDHLSEIATQNHFDSLLNRLSSISTEENHLKILMLDSYEVHRMMDWSPEFIQEFESRYLYDPTPYLPLLLDYQHTDSILADRFRGDYSRLVSDMMIENHFGQSVTIADKYGIEMLTEAGHGGSPRVDALKALGHSHIPMGEFWNRQRFWVTKEAASAAHIYGLNLVAAESLTGWNHWQHGPADFKQLIDIAFCEGLNQVVFHTFAHNPKIAGKPGFVYHAGEHINVNTTWWDLAKPFMDYIGRASYMLRQGLFVADACLYYGDQAPNLVPSKRIDPNITPIFDDTQCLHCGQPKPVNPGSIPGFDYDYMNAEIITTAMRVEDGRLLLPTGQGYQVMLLPDEEAISLEVLQRLEELVKQGATIIGRKPTRTTSMKNYPDCDAELKAIADRMWGDCDGLTTLSNTYGSGTVYWGKSLNEVLLEKGIRPDFQVKGIDNSDQHIDYIHRQTQEEDIYFVSNSNQSSEKFTAVFRVDPSRKPEIWDPMTGQTQTDLDYRKTAQAIEMEFSLSALASRFVVFAKTNSVGRKDEANYDFQFSQVAHPVGDNKTGKTLDISHDWELFFDEEMGAPAGYHLDSLVSWTQLPDQGIQYYSGKVVYRKKITIDETYLTENTEAYLQIGHIEEVARVKLNSLDCGILWAPPYLANLTNALKAGENVIEIEVMNTWNNRLVGDVLHPDGPQYTSTNIKNKFSHGNLLDSGLIGCVVINFTQ